MRREAITGGLINGTMNGVINWYSFRDHASLFLTDNLIDSRAETVFAGAVPLAVSVAFILTSIAFFKTKQPGKPPYFPKVFLMALKHSVYAFGLVTIFAILLQRYAGSIEVTPVVAAVITGVVASLVATIVNFETRKSLLHVG
jgi:putative flippase GtrA